MLDKLVFAKGMTFLSIALKEKNLNDTVLDVYYEVLKDMSDESFESSIKQVAQTRTYSGIPTPAEILKFDVTNDVLLTGTREKAQAMYNKFYNQNCSMTDYTQRNRNKVPNDRNFFENMDYKALRQADGTETYTKQELYVLNALGGGSWLADIRFLPNTEVAINKIENIIKSAIITKYKSNDNAIENKSVRKLIAEVA